MIKKSLTISDFLDRARKMQGLDSDRKLNDALGYQGQIVNAMRVRGVLPSEPKMLLIADMIGMDHMEALTWLSYWEAEKRQEPAVADIWMHALKAMKKAGHGPAIIAVLLTAILSAPDAHATNNIGTKHNGNHTLYTLCDNY